MSNARDQIYHTDTSVDLSRDIPTFTQNTEVVERYDVSRNSEQETEEEVQREEFVESRDYIRDVCIGDVQREQLVFHGLLELLSWEGGTLILFERLFWGII